MVKKVKHKVHEPELEVVDVPKRSTHTAKPITPEVGDDSVTLLQKQNMVNALSYVPYFFGPILMFFLGDANKKRMMHHIKYALILAIVYVVLMLPFNDTARMVLNIIYLVASGYFAYQAYKGDDVRVELFETIEDKIQEKVKK